MNGTRKVREVLVPSVCAECGRAFDTVFRETQEGEWAATETMLPRTERKKGAKNISGSVKIKGQLAYSASFKCPHCANRTYYICGTCRTLNCYDGDTTETVCANCGNSVVIISDDHTIDGLSASLGANSPN